MRTLHIAGDNVVARSAINVIAGSKCLANALHGFAIAVIVAVATLAGSAPASAQFFTREVPPKLEFFRVKAKYTVKESGETVAFDFVRPCRAVYGRDFNGDTFSLGPGKIDPSDFFGYFVGDFPKVTRDGHAVVIKIPDVCSGKSVRNDGAAVDFVPATRWYDNADDLSYGIMYAAEEAYQSPWAKIIFDGASVQSATASDFKDWQQHAADDFRSSRAVQHPFGFSNSDIMGGKLIATACFGVARLELPPELKDLAVRARPSSDTRFWTLQASKDAGGDHAEAANQLLEEFSHPKNRTHLFGGRLLNRYRPIYGNSSVPTEDRGSIDDRSARTGELHPVYHEAFALSTFAADRQAARPLYTDIDLRPESRGFLLCATTIPFADLKKAAEGLSWAGWFAAQTPIAGSPHIPTDTPPAFFFENADYLHLRSSQ
ncbi:hypothetical protein [Bradyrhizobium diazoefficiens]|nr:hypothetical protein XF15B_24100 [Bradyrhizobium diazoefficiens]